MSSTYFVSASVLGNTGNITYSPGAGFTYGFSPSTGLPSISVSGITYNPSTGSFAYESPALGVSTPF